jgi:hypothetical protein
LCRQACSRCRPPHDLAARPLIEPVQVREVQSSQQTTVIPAIIHCRLKKGGLWVDDQGTGDQEGTKTMMPSLPDTRQHLKVQHLAAHEWF